MTIEIKAPVTKEKLKKAIDKISKDSFKKTPEETFRSVKMGLDSLD
jgi:hypothetical protein